MIKKNIFISLICIFAVYSEIKSEETCGENEELTDCGSACIETCETLTGILPQPSCTKQCVLNVCRCRSGFIRKSSTNNTCVPEKFCFEQTNEGPILVDPLPNSNEDLLCKKNEVLSECGGACIPNCATYLGLEPPKLCPLYCQKPGTCVCAPGFVRRSDANSTCVPEEKCSELENHSKECGKHEVLTNCGSSCQTTCAIQLGLEPVKPCIYMCLRNSCVCEPGYVRVSDTDRTCVAADSCSRYYSKPNPCSGNNACGNYEVMAQCGTPCPRTCENVLGIKPERVCPTFACMPGCECQQGFVRLSETDNTCVPENSCSKYYSDDRCGVHETWVDCPGMCQPSCENSLISAICLAGCNPNHCVCKPGYIRVSDDNPTCVPDHICLPQYPPFDPRVA